MDLNLPSNASIIVLTGAGISAESGLETFRAQDGLWCNHRIEDVATPDAFQRNPALVHKFYNMRRNQLQNPDVKPNPAHLALAKLEKHWPGTVYTITQNVDNLHERAGCENVIHMHGELMRAFCYFCNHKITCHHNLSQDTLCQNCQKPGGMRPDIVWFGEIPYHMNQIANLLTNCDLFLSIGTSGNVYPASSFASEANNHGAITIEFNLEPSLTATIFQHHIYGSAGKTLPHFTSDLLKK